MSRIPVYLSYIHSSMIYKRDLAVPGDYLYLDLIFAALPVLPRMAARHVDDEQELLPLGGGPLQGLEDAIGVPVAR